MRVGWTVWSLRESLSALNIDAYCCMPLVVTPIVDGSYHEGVGALFLSRLEICRRMLATF